jgi:hypothetical protein
MIEYEYIVRLSVRDHRDIQHPTQFTRHLTVINNNPHRAWIPPQVFQDLNLDHTDIVALIQDHAEYFQQLFNRH